MCIPQSRTYTWIRNMDKWVLLGVELKGRLWEKRDQKVSESWWPPDSILIWPVLRWSSSFSEICRGACGCFARYYIRWSGWPWILVSSDFTDAMWCRLRTPTRRRKRFFNFWRSTSLKILSRFGFPKISMRKPTNSFFSDRTFLLSSDCWNTARIRPFCTAVLLFLWRSREAIRTIQEWLGKCMSIVYLQLALLDSTSKILLRLIDDYLFITTSLSRAKRFLNMMNQGVLSKTYTRFPNSDLRHRASWIWVFHIPGEDSDKLWLWCSDTQCHWAKARMSVCFTCVLSSSFDMTIAFPWCGYMINMKDLSVSVDYTRYHGTGKSGCTDFSPWLNTYAL